jgi:uncharacterized membrane protein (UPF0127 family)
MAKQKQNRGSVRGGGENIYARLGLAAWVGLFIVIAGVLAMVFAGKGSGSPTVADPPPTHIDVMLAGQPFTLELAMNHETRKTGLMQRPSLPADRGMLFVFHEAAERRFWMYRCLIPLDIIFLDGDRKIVSIHTLPAPPPGTPAADSPQCISAAPAQYVLELNAGQAAQLQLQPGQALDLPVADLKRHVR